jgi:methyl-accepting chemotaxis protein
VARTAYDERRIHPRAKREITSMMPLQRPRARGQDRLALGAIGVLIVLAIIGVVIAVWLLLDLRRATTDLTERDVDYAAAMGDVALISKTLANDERGFLISGSEEFREQFDGRIAQVHEAYERAYANADADQWLAVDRAQKSFEQWLNATRLNMDAFARGERDTAIEASLEETRVLRKEYEARLAGTQSLAAFAIETSREQVAGSVTRAVAILIGYLVVAMVVGLLIAAWIARSVLLPAGELRRRLDETTESDAHRVNDLA